MDHGGCSLLVGIEDERVVSIRPDRGGELNKGYICPKALASIEKLYHPQRLKMPLLRNGKRGEGKFKEISWDDALEIISRRFLKIKSQWGPQGVAFCNGMPKGLELFVLIRLANTFGSPNVVAIQDVCHAPREIAGLHTCGFYPVVDQDNPTNLIMLWGSNIPKTNEEGVICTWFFRELERGAKLIVVDPVLHSTIKDKVSLFLNIRPGTDAALALSMISVIIQEGIYDKEFVEKWCYGFESLKEYVKDYNPKKVTEIVQIPPKDIYEAAVAYARTKPACIVLGNAIEQTINNFSASRAIIMLMAICGNLDVPGGNIQALEPNVLGLREFVKADLLPDKAKKMVNFYFKTIPRFMTVPPAYFRKAVLEGIPYKIKACYFQGTNPLVTWPDSRLTKEALEALEFSVVSDVFLTPTAMYADLVLPVATQFEFNDIGHYGLGHGFILPRPKLVDPPPECWPDIKILNELGKRISNPEYWYEDYEDLLREVIGPSNISLHDFMNGGMVKAEMRYKKYQESGFKTPSGKVELILTKANEYNVDEFPIFYEYDEIDERFPLIFTSMKEGNFLHSSYRWLRSLRKLTPKPYFLIHPDTAQKFGIKENEDAIIETKYGAIFQKAKLSKNVKPGVVIGVHGWWFPESGKEGLYSFVRSNINMLNSIKTLGKEFGTPQLRGIPCNIKKVRGSE